MDDLQTTRRSAFIDRIGDANAIALNLTVAMVLGTLLRFAQLGAIGFNYDELYAVRIHGLSAWNIAGVIARTAFYDLHPPLYYLCPLAWCSLFGPSEVSARGFSAVCGVATIFALYKLVAELTNPRVGARAAIVLALIPLHVYYSREARMYALLALLATTSTWLLARMVRGQGRALSLFAWLAVSSLTVMTHYFGVLVVLSQAALLGLRARSHTEVVLPWIALLAVPAGVFLPFAVFASYQSGHFHSGYLEFGVGVYARVLRWLGGGHQNVPIWWTIPVAGATIAALIRYRRRQFRYAPNVSRELSPPPAPTAVERVLVWAIGLGAVCALALVFFRGSDIIERVVALTMRRGEPESIARVQGRTVFAAMEALCVGVLLGAVSLSLRTRLEAFLTRQMDRQSVPVERSHPLGSPVRVAVVMIATPLVMTVLAGLLGRPLVLVRNFIVAIPFVSLLVAVGFDTVSPALRRAVGLALAVFALYVNAHFQAIPWVTVNTYSLSPWLLHTHTDWRVLRHRIPADSRLPILTARHYSTDAVGFYARVPVARIDEVPADRPLRVSQVITDDDDLVSESPWRNDTELWAARPAEFWWLDPPRLPAPVFTATCERLAHEIRARYSCTNVGPVPGGGNVYRCALRPTLASIHSIASRQSLVR